MSPLSRVKFRWTCWIPTKSYNPATQGLIQRELGVLPEGIQRAVQTKLRGLFAFANSDSAGADRPPHLAPVLSVRSVEESLQFYQQALGFSEWFRWEQHEQLAAAGVVRGNARIILDPATRLTEEEMKHRGTGVELYVDVGGADIDAYYAQVNGRAKVIDPISDKPWGDRVFTVADPDGYRISFARTGG